MVKPCDMIGYWCCETNASQFYFKNFFEAGSFFLRCAYEAFTTPNSDPKYLGRSKLSLLACVWGPS